MDRAALAEIPLEQVASPRAVTLFYVGRDRSSVSSREWASIATILTKLCGMMKVVLRWLSEESLG